jgi:hypothetical protein
MSQTSQAILEELKKYNKINNYIFEQETGELPPPPAEPTDDPAALPPADAGTTPPPADTEVEPQPVDIENDPDVEKIDDSGEDVSSEDSDELEITDLVSAQKNIETKQEEYFQNLFNQLGNLESKLQDMNSVIEKLNSIESKIEKYREKTPQEKLELRSLDSGPFNQKLTDFFADKEEDLEKSGKNEYILTTDEVEDYSPDEIKRTFDTYTDEDDFKEIKY